jgi:2-dehydro-3-deoxy-D-arabinonate dehydratase
MISLLRFWHPERGACIGCNIEDTVYDISDQLGSVATWLKTSAGRLEEAIRDLERYAKQAETRLSISSIDRAPDPHAPHWLAPVDDQDIWAAGVTYHRSREARQLEAIDGGDIYARVYLAERPELFFKAAGQNAVGHRAAVGIRADAHWSVPEPELALVLNPAMEVAGITIANDMSSRDIEGANPLYLPQAKIYTASCALGPWISLQPLYNWPQTKIELLIERMGNQVFSGSIDTSQIQRPMQTLIDYLSRSNQFPNGVVLLTGTGIVPPEEFTLQDGDEISIAIQGIGILTNWVRVV